MSPKTLPQELIEHIIDAIHVDDVDHYFLSIVSRVAKAWRPRSQALIFREIILEDSLVLPSRLKTLLSRSPHLAPYVQTLRLGDGDIVELCAICSSLTNISELFLREIQLSSEHSLRSFGDFLSSLSSLSSLSLRECTLSRTAVQALFHSCTSLKAISFTACEDDSKPTPLPFTSLAAPRNLRSIACDGLSAAVLDSLAISTFAPGLPTHLHLGAGINYQPAQIRLLNSVKDQLESVELLASWCWPLERELFLPCNRIRTLTLDIETAPIYLPEIIPSSIPTFRELRIIFTKYWGSGTSPEDVFSRRKERIEKIGTMAAQRGVQKVVWEVRLDEYDVDQTEFRGWFEGQVRKFMGLPDEKYRVEFVWQDGYPVRRW